MKIKHSAHFSTHNKAKELDYNPSDQTRQWEQTTTTTTTTTIEPRHCHYHKNPRQEQDHQQESKKMK